MRQLPHMAGAPMSSRVPKEHRIVSYNGRTTVISGISLPEVSSPTVSERRTLDVIVKPNPESCHSPENC